MSLKIASFTEMSNGVHSLFFFSFFLLLLLWFLFFFNAVGVFFSVEN